MRAISARTNIHSAQIVIVICRQKSCCRCYRKLGKLTQKSVVSSLSAWKVFWHAFPEAFSPFSLLPSPACFPSLACHPQQSCPNTKLFECKTFRARITIVIKIMKIFLECATCDGDNLAAAAATNLQLQQAAKKIINKAKWKRIMRKRLFSISLQFITTREERKGEREG